MRNVEVTQSTLFCSEKIMQAAIYGFEGTVLTADEIAFFKETQPLGFIVFKRNCESRQQLRALTDSLRELTGREQLPILIDQEGGRVARLGAPEWEVIPPAAIFDELAQKTELSKAERGVYLQARIIAAQLTDVGISVNCAPLADIPAPDAHDIIGDRAFGKTAPQVVKLARQQSEGLMAGGILPILKHIPGHGRAMADSHEDLPVVEAALAELEASDFIPFRELADIPLGMTAHIIYTALDDKLTATQSPKLLKFIREKIGFGGLLMSDDLSMKALGGTFRERAEITLQAGCDVLLHCNGKMDEMTQVASGAQAMTEKAYARMDAAWKQLEAKSQHHDKVELVDIRTELSEILAA